MPEPKTIELLGKVMLTGEDGINVEPLELSPEEVQFTSRVYKQFIEADNLFKSPQDLLGGRTLTQYFADCDWDYNVLVEEGGDNDPVKQYSSAISRDKSNAFIGRLTSQLMYPGVAAQNQDQEIDFVMSKVSRSLLEWAHDNDGRPDESGQLKMVRNVHKMVVQGTCHVDDSIIDNHLFSSLVPNEEIRIVNFKQPSIQLQPRLFRVQDNITYEEAMEKFGELPRFKYVQRGNIANWLSNNLSYLNSLIEKDKVQIIYFWENIPKSKFKDYKIPKNQKRAKLFNIWINGVMMFKIDNMSPYKDGLYPISKGIFEHFSDPNYYWGNSMPNKAKQDKRWLDGWKTLIRHKAKLAAIPPQITFNGTFVDSDIYIPGEITQAPNGMKKDDIMSVPGVDKGVTQSDVLVLNDAKSEINDGNLSPQASGGQGGQQTAREAIIREQNEQEILGSFGQQIGFLIEARTYPILKRLFQFLSKNQIKKISIPDQDIGNGVSGSYEVIFEKMEPMTEEQQNQRSIDIFKIQKDSEKAGRPKKIVYINPSYLNELDLYIKVVADPQPKKTTALRKAEAMEKFGIYSNRPDLFNVKSAAKKLVRDMGDDPNDMINNQANALPSQPTNPNGQLTNKLNKARGQETANLGELNM